VFTTRENEPHQHQPSKAGIVDHSDNAKTTISKHVRTVTCQRHQQANSNYNADIHSPMKEKSIGYTDHTGFSSNQQQNNTP